MRVDAGRNTINITCRHVDVAVVSLSVRPRVSRWGDPVMCA
ncbi:hypothetical protein FDG2_1206 [Candidatus Protofrankia californiensis]|uniref:Uncharacterized protein n=1 Tax=Candidatus Protofrankia californiensis TaxID=1839754 RepID=A0A1C3NV92_9ACTN|nr:hypothetical protein FDG2_1206 [Candidatus Protofrankia californiensis]